VRFEQGEKNSLVCCSLPILCLPQCRLFFFSICAFDINAFSLSKGKNTRDNNMTMNNSGNDKGSEKDLKNCPHIPLLNREKSLACCS
jgi:hypothetical protein